MEPIGGLEFKFNIRYYMFAPGLVIFDVETVFPSYPWPCLQPARLLAFIEALIFIAILVVAPGYAWRQRRPRRELNRSPP